MDAIENYLHNKEAEEKASPKEWTNEISQSAPQQDNFNDSSFYICMNARRVSRAIFYQVLPVHSKTSKHMHINELLNLKVHCITSSSV